MPVCRIQEGGRFAAVVEVTHLLMTVFKKARRLQLSKGDHSLFMPVATNSKKAAAVVFFCESNMFFKIIACNQYLHFKKFGGGC
jgi:hypothetical protein